MPIIPHPIWDPQNEGELIAGIYLGRIKDFYFFRDVEYQPGEDKPITEHKTVIVRARNTLSELDNREKCPVCVVYLGKRTSKKGYPYDAFSIDDA